VRDVNAREGEKEQRFIRLYQSYVSDVYRFIYDRSGFDRVTAEDITQDIFIDVYKGLDRFKGFCSERTWIYRIARNKLNDYYRKLYGQKTISCDISEAETLHDPAQNIDTQMEKSFESRFIRDCLERLPQQYRTVLLMKYVDSQSVRQIGEIIGKPRKAAESMLYRAKAAFIKEYKALKEREGI
jgi:RNA polymerase sigma-70 factor (ECF subfamily)